VLLCLVASVTSRSTAPSVAPGRCATCRPQCKLLCSHTVFHPRISRRFGNTVLSSICSWQ